MPFLDNTGLDPDVERGPLWDAFAALFDQLERYVLLNLAWSVQLVPLMLALFFVELPSVVRAVLLIYSVVALAIATGLLFRLVYLASDGEMLRLSLVREELREIALPSLLTLAPLYGIFGVLIGLITWASGTGLFIIDVIARLGLLLAFVSSVYWGPLFASDPSQSMIGNARQSLRLFWRSPGLTLLVAVAVIITVGIGVVSVGGIFLVMGVLVALLQTQMTLKLMKKKQIKRFKTEQQ
jgi:hypothetical protein